MNKNFAAAMQHAVESLRSRDVSAATRIVQAALAGPSPQQPKPRPSGRVRKPLGEALRALRAGRMPATAKPHVLPLPIPAGAQYLRRSFSCAVGTRAYSLYIPAPRPGGLNGLILMLHGCTQNSDDFAAGTAMNRLAEERGLIVAYPEQIKAANTMSCWNWFEPGHQRRGAGEPAILAGMAMSLRDEFGVAPSGVFAAGLSAGGAMAAILSETYPDVFAAVGIHSGLAYQSAHDVASAFAAMRGTAGSGSGGSQILGPGSVRTILFQGSADHTVHASNAESIIAAATARLPSRGRQRREEGSAGGRHYTRTIIAGEAGRATVECWLIEGAGHAWSGGDARGSYTDMKGPDASAEMVRFFLEGGDIARRH